MSSQSMDLVTGAAARAPRRNRRKSGARGLDLVSFRISPDAKARLQELQAPNETLHQTARRMALANSDLAAHARVSDALMEFAGAMRALSAESRERHRDLSRLSEALRFVIKRGEERAEAERALAQSDAGLRALMVELVGALNARTESLEIAVNAVAEGLAELRRE